MAYVFYREDETMKHRIYYTFIFILFFSITQLLLSQNQPMAKIHVDEDGGEQWNDLFAEIGRFGESTLPGCETLSLTFIELGGFDFRKYWAHIAHNI